MVNCHGWVSGLGLDLLSKILQHLSPSHVLQVRVLPVFVSLSISAFVPLSATAVMFFKYVFCLGVSCREGGVKEDYGQF